ncbi:MAG: hypothetical protein AB1507_04365 [Bacillota bacterium]|nr:hypothetical protein [Thermoanaerobacteraceae bacterium]
MDEVLAVGDLAFQEKCLNRIRELQKKGVTIVFVTHNPKQVEELCNSAVWLDKGEVRFTGPANEAARAYAAFLGRVTG